MNKIYPILFISVILFVAYKNLPDIMSNGAPAASTGAPDERNCATSGCHSDFVINSGAAEVALSPENGITQYELGKTYPIAVSVSNPGTMRFGFQLVALKNSDNTNAGTIKLLDPARTQLVSGFGNTINRQYITYTFAGTGAVSAGLGKWTFNWTAPEENIGAVTFYLACISANNDGTDMGDYTFTRKVMLDAPPAVSWNIYPTFSSGEFTVYNLSTGQAGLKSADQIQVYNSSGKYMFQKTINCSNSSGETVNLNTANSGVYFVSVTQNGNTTVQKVVITR